MILFNPYMVGMIRGSLFPQGICPKGNAIGLLEFERAYFEATVEHFSHYTMTTFL